MGKAKAKNELHIVVDGRKEVVNVIWQPKYIGSRREFWLLESKMGRYNKMPGDNHTVYITFEKDEHYGLSGRVFRVKGGSLHITMQCELFYHEGTGFSYYRIPLDDLVEVHDVRLPDEFLQRVEEYKAIKMASVLQEEERDDELDNETRFAKETNFEYDVGDFYEEC